MAEAGTLLTGSEVHFCMYVKACRHLAPNPPRAAPPQDARIAALAAKYGKDVGQLMLRWAIQRGTAVVAKSVTSSRIVSNFEVRAGRGRKEGATLAATPRLFLCTIPGAATRLLCGALHSFPYIPHHACAAPACPRTP